MQYSACVHVSLHWVDGGVYIMYNDAVQYTSYSDSQLLSSLLKENLLICSQLEKRNMILMLWQPEQSCRQLEQVAGDSKDIFSLIIFPSLSYCLSTKHTKKNKAESSPHPLSRKSNDFWLILRMGNVQSNPMILTIGKIINPVCNVNAHKDVHEIIFTVFPNSIFKALHAVQCIWKYTHCYHLVVDFLHQLSHLVLIIYHAHCLGCQSWIPPMLLLPLLFGLFLQVLDFCCQPPLLCLPLA